MSNAVLAGPPVRSITSLARNMATMGGAELINRVTRIATAMALAWALTPFEFGLAAVAITATDIMRALTQTGIGARIISVDEAGLEATCTTSYRLNWWVYGIVALIQCGVAWPVALHFGDERIAWLMWALSAPYLLYPLVAVQVYRVQRQHRMRETAMMLVLLLSGDNMLTALMALSGFSLWSLAIPKTICAIAWVIAYRRLEPWKPRGERAAVAPLLRYGFSVMASEMTSVLRLHADKLLIGQILGLSVMGQYFFAFNAGLGITSALVTAAATSLLPHFSGVSTSKDLRKRYLTGTGLLLSFVVPAIAAQSLLAPWYVPLVFGEKWVGAVPLLMALCWLGVPMLLSRTSGLLLRARGLAALEFKLSVSQAIVTLIALAVSLQFGLMTSIFAQLAAFTLASLLSTYFAFRACSSTGDAT